MRQGLKWHPYRELYNDMQKGTGQQSPFFTKLQSCPLPWTVSSDHHDNFQPDHHHSNKHHIPPPHVLYLVSPDPILLHKVLALCIMVLPFKGFFFRNAATTNGVSLLHSDFVLRAEKHRAQSWSASWHSREPRSYTTRTKNPNHYIMIFFWHGSSYDTQNLRRDNGWKIYY